MGTRTLVRGALKTQVFVALHHVGPGLASSNCHPALFPQTGRRVAGENSASVTFCLRVCHGDGT